MSKLVVLLFDSEDEAKQVREALKRQERSGRLDIEDAAVVVRDAGGKIHVRGQMSDTSKYAVVGGGLLGLLLAVFFPFLGIAAGAAVGGITAKVLDNGVDGKFVKEVAAALEPGHSALFVVSNSAEPDAIVATLRGFKGELYHSNLDPEAETALRQALHSQAMPTA